MPDNDDKNKTSGSKKHTYQAIRNCKIVKSNELIQKSKYELSAQEQKIIMYLISKVKPKDEAFITTEFDIIEFCCVCGIDIKAGKNRKDIISAIKEVADRSIWVRLENNKITTLRWIDKPVIDELTGMMQVKLDDLLKPFLLKLENNFTQFELIYTLAMKSKYSIRLYEILKSYEYKKSVMFSVGELKGLLNAANYNTYKDFRVRVLDAAVNEINDLSDLNVSYEAAKQGRGYSNVKFMISLKLDLDERFAAWKKIQNVIGK